MNTPPDQVFIDSDKLQGTRELVQRWWSQQPTRNDILIRDLTDVMTSNDQTVAAKVLTDPFVRTTINIVHRVATSTDVQNWVKLQYDL